MTADELKGAACIDTRDILKAARELRDELEDEPRELDDDETALLDFDDDGPGEIGEYQWGATMIREDHFEDYARELAEDIGAIASGAQWPTYCIDWERAARELSQDYSTITFLGHDYLVRA